MEVKTHLTSMEALAPLMQEQLAAGQAVRFSPKGVSMLPMLREGRDSVVLSPKPDRLQKYDLPLYRRDDGAYVLHRVVRVEQAYTCIGDNQFVLEPGVRHDQVIGVVTAFTRGERLIPVTAPMYRLYCVFWHGSRPIRHLWRRGVAWIRRRLT